MRFWNSNKNKIIDNSREEVYVDIRNKKNNNTSTTHLNEKNSGDNHSVFDSLKEQPNINTEEILNSNASENDNNLEAKKISKKEYYLAKISNNYKRKSDSSKKLKNSEDYIIELSSVSKSYLMPNFKAAKILNNIDLKIKKGDFVVLFGKSGSGKSTLLNIMSGLDRPTNGNVIVSDTNLPYLSNGELTKFRRDHISFIFQQYHLLNNISGYDNVQTGAALQKDKSKALDIESLFKEFDLEEVMHKFPSQMSGGQQQRISILRALAKDSEIIFADEPTGALDKKTGNIVMNLLQKINKENGKTIIVVSHDPEVTRYAKRKIFLNKGKIIKDELIVQGG